MRYNLMRIAFFTDAFLPQINGVVSYLIEIASKLCKHGHEVIVFAPKPRRGVKVDISNYPFEAVLIPSIPSFLYPDIRITFPSLPRTFLQLKKFAVDIIHINDPGTLGTEGIMLAKILKVPSLITFHTFFLDEEILKNVKFWKVISYLDTPLWHLMAYYHDLADIVVCPSRVSQKELTRHGLKKPSVVINHGIDLGRMKTLSAEERARLRRLYNINQEDKVGIFVGRIAVDKSLDILIRAWKLVCLRYDSAKLLLVGRGPKEADLKKLTEKLNLSENIIFTGAMSREEILNSGIYKIADIFVTASKIENQSFSMIEAMAHALPIVAVDMRGAPELVDKQNGILVDADSPSALAAAVIRLFSDRLCTKKLAQGSLDKSKKYDLDYSVTRLEKLYRDLVDKKQK